MIAGVNLHIAW
jgi:hypothetical protein